MHPALRHYYYSSSRGGIPEASDALFHLNGVIEEDAGSYYFSDNTGNGRRFLITGKDFPSDWTVGFPYKSKATISAPAGDAVLIAADINNYLYAGDGTPNEIPVVSLFQDIDYEHKLFTRHVARVLNAADEESIQPRVAEIVMYSAARADEGLTQCQSYFSVPTEATSNVKWISKDGDDTTGTGTKANPWLTITKATNGGATNGDTIYVKSGDYQENHTGTTGYWMNARSATVIGLGRVNVTSANTSFASFILSAVTLTVKGLVIGNAVASSTTVIGMAAVASTLTFERCWLKNGFSALSVASAVSLTVKDVIYSGITNRFVATANTTLTITGCHSTDNVSLDINTATALHTVTIQYNKIFIASLTNGHSVNLDISYNDFGAVTVGGDSDVTSSSSSLRINRNIVGHSGTETKIHVLHNYYDTEIGYNRLTGTSIGASIRLAGEQTTAWIHHNIVNGLTLPAWIAVGGETSLAKTITIEDNAVYSGGGTTPLFIGSDVEAVEDWFDTYTGTIRRNVCIGQDSIDNHGITVFNQSGVSIEHCYADGFTFAAIIKVQGLDLSNAPIQYCVSVNCQNGIAAKGGVNQSIVNNTIIDPVAYGFFNSYNPFGLSPSEGTIFKNNIIVERGVASTYVAIKQDGSGCTITSDNNIIYSLNNSDVFNNGGTDITFAQWQALPQDANSLITEPSLDGDYVPTLPIVIGADLGDSYDTGLDISTDWGTSSSIPVVVTRDQQASGDWEIGAYVQR